MNPLGMETNLHLDIKHNDLPLAHEILNHLLARTISILSKLCMLNEAILGDQVFEFLHGDVIIIYIASFSRSGVSCRV